MLAERIEHDMHDAMKERNALKVGILKYIISEFQRRPNLKEDISDDDALAIIKKYIKTTEESGKLIGFLTEEQKGEIEILTKYIPEQASVEEIREWILNNITLDENPQKRVKSMGVVMKQFKGRADGNVVREILMEM